MARIAKQLKQLAVPIADLVEDPGNARVHGERNVAAIKASLERFGQRVPIVVQKEGMVVRAGNARLRAAQELGWPDIAALIVDEDDVDATAYALADNRTAELAEWDTAALMRQIEAANVDGLELPELGFDAQELAELRGSLQSPQLAEEDGPAPEPPAEAFTQPGDLYEIGSHRLLCGDSTQLEHVQRLMDGHKAALVATDPPYLMNYTGERPNDSGKDWSDTYREVDIKDADQFFRSVFTNVLQVIGPRAAIYTWHSHRRQGIIARIWDDLGILDHQQIIWVKPTAVFGRVYWHFQHEPALMGWAKGSPPEHDGDHSITSVWALDWEGKMRIVGNEHPTQKPVAIFGRPIAKHTGPGAVCFEPFCGSGSQLVAAEQLGRRCFAMEIEPQYVDVAVRRWRRLTGGVVLRNGEDVTAQFSDEQDTVGTAPEDDREAEDSA